MIIETKERRIWIGFTVMVFIQLLLLAIFAYTSYVQILQVKMLKARARIQYQNYKALQRAGLLTDEEVRIVEANFVDAEYDLDTK